jgi:Fe-S cluster assembly iron-binding protein IscA
MMKVTEKVAERLKKELVAACSELGGEFITMFSANTKDVNQQLIDRCYEFGLGFRVAGGTDENGRVVFNIKLDNKNIWDEVVDAYGVKIFLDPVSAVHLKDYELDCIDDEYKGFFLRERQGVTR